MRRIRLRRRERHVERASQAYADDAVRETGGDHAVRRETGDDDAVRREAGGGAIRRVGLGRRHRRGSRSLRFAQVDLRRQAERIRRPQRRGVSFTYNHDLSAWGYSSGALGGVACLFVQKTNGQWVGGKFDWISSSRRSRGFENVFGGYAGWSLEGVPNPCAAAFVIVSPDGKRRSNVIAGTWSR